MFLCFVKPRKVVYQLFARLCSSSSKKPRKVHRSMPQCRSCTRFGTPSARRGVCALSEGEGKVTIIDHFRLRLPRSSFMLRRATSYPQPTARSWDAIIQISGTSISPHMGKPQRSRSWTQLVVSVPKSSSVSVWSRGSCASWRRMVATTDRLWALKGCP